MIYAITYLVLMCNSVKFINDVFEKLGIKQSNLGHLKLLSLPPIMYKISLKLENSISEQELVQT